MAATKEAGGVGTANDATVVVENNVAALSAALEEARQREKDAFYDVQIENAKRYKEKIATALAGADESIANAEAAKEAHLAELEAEAKAAAEAESEATEEASEETE